MKQDILNALCGDEAKYELIIQKTQQPDISRMRWEVFVILRLNGHKVKDIAKFFNQTPAAVRNGIKKTTNTKELEAQTKITSEIINGLGVRDSDAIYEGLNNLGYSAGKIAKYYNTTKSKVLSGIRRAKESKAIIELNNRRKSFVKL